MLSEQKSNAVFRVIPMWDYKKKMSTFFVCFSLCGIYIMDILWDIMGYIRGYAVMSCNTYACLSV